MWELVCALEPQPYLRAVPDTAGPGEPDFCARSPYHHWVRVLTAQPPFVKPALGEHHPHLPPRSTSPA